MVHEDIVPEYITKLARKGFYTLEFPLPAVVWGISILTHDKAPVIEATDITERKHTRVQAPLSGEKPLLTNPKKGETQKNVVTH